MQVRACLLHPAPSWWGDVTAEPHIITECLWAVCLQLEICLGSSTQIIGFLWAIELNDAGQWFPFVRTGAGRGQMTLSRESGAWESRQSCRAGQKSGNRSWSCRELGFGVSQTNFCCKAMSPWLEALGEREVLNLLAKNHDKLCMPWLLLLTSCSL